MNLTPVLQATVLVFHQIAEAPSPKSPKALAIPPTTFEAQVRALAGEGYQTVTPSSLQTASPERTLLITFDDGYQDNYDHAFPILQVHGFHALIFLVGDYLPRPDSGHFPPPQVSPDVPMLTAQQIRAMVAAKFEFGSHSLHHRRLSHLPHPEVDRELSLSRRLVAAVTGQPVTTFSYPYGDWAPRLSPRLAAAGYELGFTVRNGPILGDDPLAIRRIPIGPHDSPKAVVAKVAGLARWFRDPALRAGSALTRLRRK